MKTFQVNGVPLLDQTYRFNLVRMFAPIVGETFLDLGCNEGYESIAVASQGARRVVAIDGRDSYLTQLQALAKEKGLGTIETLSADVRKIDELGLGKFDNVIFFGLLYHMANPFNLLKRIRNLCSQRLFLETHVAPTTKKALLPKHERAISERQTIVTLDGENFKGRVWMSEVPDIRKTTGSLDSQRTFWVTADSLKHMLELSGFRIKEFLYDSIPARYQPWASLTNLGHENTKIFAFCEVIDPSLTMTVSPLQNPTLQTTWFEALQNRWRKLTNAVKDKIGWGHLKNVFRSKP